VSVRVGLAGKAGRRVEYWAGVLKDKEGDMPLLLAVGLAVGTDVGNGGANSTEVEARLTAPSEWTLEWVGKHPCQEGWLKLDRKGGGGLFLTKDLNFEIVGYRLGSGTRPQTIDLQLRFVALLRTPGRPVFRVLGIYRVDGDRLFLCFCWDRDKGRPASFVTQPGDFRALLVFRRKK
jgi:hypothetical protein